MLRDQIAKKLAQGLTTLLLSKHSRNVARHGIRSTRAYFSLDPGELFLG